MIASIYGDTLLRTLAQGSKENSNIKPAALLLKNKLTYF